MMQELLQLWFRSWRSIIEIILLSVGIYYFYLYFRCTRGVNVLTGLAIVKMAVVNPDTQQDDLDYAPPASEPELKKFLHHGNTASAVRNAATFSFTSWTRKISAPRARRIPVSAIVGAARALISEEFISFPRNDLRET